MASEKPATRRERDPLGEVEVPQDAYYGVQTARAVGNFPISGIRPHRKFIAATAMVKWAAAEANRETGRLAPRLAEAIIKGAREVVQGKWDTHFVVDVFQAGAGTSHNMNANEVIANRAIEILGGSRGDYKTVHPNDHVNMSQSTNDVFPTAMRVAALLLAPDLVDALERLAAALDGKGREFGRVIKSGRTHLQDATPVRLGQEFGAYAAAIQKGRARIRVAMDGLRAIGMGGTAVGTGINIHPDYRRIVTERLAEISGLPLLAAEDYFEAMQSMAPFVALSGALRELAVELIRIANDLRLLSSGPRTGLGEITLPPVQPGSSIMPGKVNPVMAEVTDMIGFHVIGNDLTVAMAAQAGQLELNVMMPVINFNLLQSLEILANGVRLFTDRCVVGITANVERCRELAGKSIGLATILNPSIGYEAAAAVAKEATARGKSLRDVVVEKKILSPEEADRILNPAAMTEPGYVKKEEWKEEKRGKNRRK